MRYILQTLSLRPQNSTMAKDRLCELKQGSRQCANQSNNDDVIRTAMDADECTQLQSHYEGIALEGTEEWSEVEHTFVPHSPVLEALFKVYSEILQEFNLIQRNMDTMKEMVLAKNADKYNEKEFYKIRHRTVQVANNVMGKFQTIENNLPEEGDFRTIARMKRILYFGSFQRYVDIWTDTERFLQEHETSMKNRLRAQSRILDITLTETEIDMLVSNKETNLYACNILQDTENARKTLQALEDRLGELHKLEKSIEEIHTLFIRLQRMVVEQGTIMQRIEKHYNDAENYVDVAAGDIAQVRTIAKSRLKKRTIIVLIFVLLILISILLIFLL